MEKIIADFHVHTDASVDSSRSYDSTLSQAETEGMEFIAITDHNTVYSLEESSLREKGRLRVIEGIEFSVAGDYCSKNKKDHILGLGIKNLEALRPYIQVIAKDRKLVIETTLNNLNQIYFNNGAEEFNKKIAAKDHLFKIKSSPPKGWPISLSDVYGKDMSQEEFLKRLELIPLQTNPLKYYIFNNFLDHPEELKKRYSFYWYKKIDNVLSDIFVPIKYPTHERMIKIIKDVGGLPVLAHPFDKNFDLEPNCLFNFLCELKKKGLEGIELADYTTSKKGKATQKQNDDFNQLICEMVKDIDLLLTIGSDNHRPTKKFGIIGATAEQAKPVLERLGY